MFFRIQIKRALALALVLSLWVAGDAVEIPPEAERLFAKAVISYLSGGEADAAEKAFSEIHEKWPEYADPVFNLGLLAEAKGERDAAIDYYQAFLELAPDHEKSAEALGRLLGLQESSQSQYEKYIALANRSIQKGDTNEAFANAATAKRLDATRWEAPTLAAKALMADEAWEDALPFVEEAIGLADDEQIKAELEGFREELANRLQVRKLLEEAATSEAKDDFLSAAKAYETAAGISDGAEAAYLAGMSYVMAEQFESAKSWFTKVIEKGNGDWAEQAKEQLGFIESRLRIEEATTRTGQADDALGLPGGAYFEKGVDALYNGRANEAIAAFDRAISQVPVNPRFARYFLMRGAAKLETDDAKGALADLNRAALIDAESPDLRALRARAHETLGNVREAIADYRNLLEQTDAPELRVKIGQLLVQQDRPRAAMDEVESILEGEARLYKADAARIWATAGNALGDETIEKYGLGVLDKLGKASAVEANRLLELRLNWVVVMTEQDDYKHQSYEFTKVDPEDKFSELWSDGASVTDYAYDEWSGEWLVVTTKDDLYKEQNANYSDKFPQDWIGAKWSQGYRISSIDRVKKSWAVVMSRRDYYGKEWYFFANPQQLEDKINKARYDGMRIHDMAYSNGYWTVVTNSQARFGDQRWILTESFPQSWINRGYDEGYRVARVAFGGGKWLTVLGQDDDAQVYFKQHEFPRDEIKRYWDNGFRITEVARVLEPLPQ